MYWRFILFFAAGCAGGVLGAWWFQDGQSGAVAPLDDHVVAPERVRGPALEPTLLGATPAPVPVAPAGASPLPTEARTEVEVAMMSLLDEERSRVRELTAEVEKLRATLPDAGIVRKLSRASIEAPEGTARELRIVALEQLLVSPKWAEQHADFLAGGGTGLSRIVPRGRFEPDLALEQGQFSGSFYGGNAGNLMDLGDIDLYAFVASQRHPPANLPARDRGRWHLLFTERPAQMRAGRFLRDLAGDRRVKAVAGHTYVLRSILEREHDPLVAFRVLEEDDTGMTLLWRILQTWVPWDHPGRAATAAGSGG